MEEPAEVRIGRGPRHLEAVRQAVEQLGLAEREERIHAAMAEAATNHAKVLELNGQLRDIVDEREALELEWLAAAEIVG